MPLTNILDNKFGFMDLDHIAPRYINELAWWEYEEYVKRLNDRIERENKKQQESQKSQPQVPDISRKIPNMNSLMNNMGKYKP
jgi:hypothetical protein